MLINVAGAQKTRHQKICNRVA